MAKDKRWNTKGWKNYDDAYAFFRAFVTYALQLNLRPGDPLPEQCRAGLTWLIEGHPNAAEKTQGGIRYFTLHNNGRRMGEAGYGFSVVDGFGVEHAFSLQVALRGEERAHSLRVQDALRNETWRDRETARKKALGSRCPETGETLREDNCEVDHAEIDFAELVRNFLSNEDLKYEDMPVHIDPCSVGRRVLSNRVQAERWRVFHATYATLEVVSIEGHKKRTAARRSNPFYGLKS
jgi:hypothetical protein